MSGRRNHGRPGGPRPEVIEWVAYLKDIGVREMHVSSPERFSVPAERSVPARPESPRRETTPRREANPRGGTVPAAGPAASGPTLFLGDGFDEPAPADPAARLEQIRREIGDCTRCRLHEQRTNVVFGVGSPRARLMFIGEGPGADEDAQGEPFVGRAGKKLDQMIASIDLRREDVYIANVVKCRPPKNREPERDEVATCSPFLFAQIEAIRPAVIVTLGAPATKTLLNTKIGITKLRGNWHSYRGIPVMPTFHPAYLLRAYTKDNRTKVYDDLLAARARMDKAP
jgi:DNA polymerase